MVRLGFRFRDHVLVCMLGALLIAPQALASVFEFAPPAFGFRDAQVVPIDMKNVEVDYVFDYRNRRATAQATVQFSMSQDGWPLLDLVPRATSISVNGQSVSLSDFLTVDDPHDTTRMRVLAVDLPAGVDHTLEISYSLRSDDLTFTNNAVRVGFFMSDLTTGGRDFLEQYAPANYEFDQVPYSFNVEVIGTSRAHTIYANGAVEVLGPNRWQIVFPEYFTTSSVYFHLTEEGRFYERRFSYDSMAGEIPVVVYSSSSSLVNSGVSGSRRVMAELEETYGPYQHDKIVVYVTSGGGGMEYGGATMTSMGALGHEFTHFWFARGVMPTNGNAGWIDEAIASWRDNGYPRARSGPNRSPVNLGGFSPYRRHTTRAAYSRGATLMSELDYLTRRDGGLRPVLRELFEEKQADTISVGYFQEFLKRTTGLDIDPIFERYVYGRSEVGQAAEGFVNGNELLSNGHPRPYTPEELRQLR